MLENHPKIVPGVLTRLASNEATVVINVMEDSNNKGVFLFHGTDVYEALNTGTSLIDMSHPFLLCRMDFAGEVGTVYQDSSVGSITSYSQLFLFFLFFFCII